MNKVILSLAFVIAFSITPLPDAFGSPHPNSSSLELRVQALETKANLLEETITQGESEIRKLWIQRNIQKKNSAELSAATQSINKKIRDQNISFEETKTGIAKVADSALLASNHLQETLNQVKSNIETHTLEIQKNANSQIQYGIVLLVLIMASWCCAYLFIRKKISYSQAKLTSLNEKIEQIKEETALRLSDDLGRLAQLANSFGKTSVATASTTNHDLIKALADRITFMEMTLFRMDKGVKGYRQLTKSIAQMKDNLLANGYEVVNMLGQPYTDGMKAVTNFIDDDTFPHGKRIITNIIKPQINYRGEMIQSAQITVSQNI